MRINFHQKKWLRKELFISEGMIPHELKLMDYYVEQEGEG